MLVSKLVLILILSSFSHSIFAISFNKYHDVNEINEYMKTEAKLNPQIATYSSLGLSAQKREIGILIISTGNALQKEAIYFNGTHHGDEKSSTEVVLGLIDFFLTHAKKPEVRAYLDKFNLYFHPLTNPDGHASNLRRTSTGADPNRDYAYPYGVDRKPFQEVEIQLVKKLVDQVKFRGALAYHSGIVEILWPWCYTDAPSKDEALLAAVTKRMAESMGITRYMPSHHDYVTTGEFIDYLHWKHGTVALTVEVSKVKTPPIAEIPTIIQTSIKGALTFMDSLIKHDKGLLKLPVNVDLSLGNKGSGRTHSLLE